MLPPTPTQLYLVWIRFRRQISFVTTFIISKWLKKYYYLLVLNLPGQGLDFLATTIGTLSSSSSLLLKYNTIIIIEYKLWNTANAFHTPLPFYATHVINPFLNSGISANHDEIEGNSVNREIFIKGYWTLLYNIWVYWN